MGDLNNERMIEQIRSVMNEEPGFEWDNDFFHHISNGLGLDKHGVGDLLLYLIENR